MQHWRSANCSLHVALCITTPQQLCFAVSTVQVTLYILQHITGDFQFALYKLHVSVLHYSTDDQFGLCKISKAMQCSNLWCVNCIMWYRSATVENFSLHCASYYMLVLLYRTGEIQFALSKLYYVILQCSISDL